MHPDGGGLYLQVTKAGVPSWVYRFLPAGGQRERYMGLGPLHTVTLAEAREMARQCRRMRLDGVDPIAARREKREAAKAATAVLTFRQCAEAYIAANRSGWRNPKHAAQWNATLSAYAYPVIGDLPVQSIDRPAVLRVLSPIWDVKTETASRVRGRIESVLGWATQYGHRTGDNPATWKGALEHALPKRSKVQPVEHHAALPFTETAAFMTELRQQEGVGARALEFAILTAARTGEVIGATWPEIDLEGRLWMIPATRMKADKEHRVPLSAAATAILRDMAEIRGGEYVFPGNRAGRTLSNMAMTMLLRRMGRGELTVHGFRSTFSDWCAEQTSFPSEVREMALAHAVGDKVEAAYRRGDMLQKRRQLADAWARYCAGPTTAGGSVVPIRRNMAAR